MTRWFGVVKVSRAMRSATSRNSPRQTASTGGRPYPENRLASEPLLVRQRVVGDSVIQGKEIEQAGRHWRIREYPLRERHDRPQHLQ